MKNLPENATSFSATPLPYSIEVTANGYGFVTECGTRYELLFYRIHPDYPIYSFSIERQSSTYRADRRVEATVLHVLRLFFEHDMNAIAFTCEIDDERQYARFRLFDKWYQPHRKDFYREVYCKDVYYSSVIARRDNPLANEMSKWFVGLMSEMIDNI